MWGVDFGLSTVTLFCDLCVEQPSQLWSRKSMKPNRDHHLLAMNNAQVDLGLTWTSDPCALAPKPDWNERESGFVREGSWEWTEDLKDRRDDRAQNLFLHRRCWSTYNNTTRREGVTGSVYINMWHITSLAQCDVKIWLQLEYHAGPCIENKCLFMTIRQSI